MRPRALWALAALQCAASPAHAEEDAQVWTSATVSGPVSGKLAIWAYGEVRFADGASGLNQALVGAGLGWEMSPGRSLYGGYLQVSNRRPRGARDEHRFWQQAAYSLGSLGPVRVAGRTMVEERLFAGAEDLGWRVQQQLRATVSLARRSRARAVLYGDLLVNLNTTDWGARSGLDQLRSFAGFSVPLGHGNGVELGYFHQHIRRPGPERTNHVALVAFTHRLGSRMRH
jgi:hypothetical protein